MDDDLQKEWGHKDDTPLRYLYSPDCTIGKSHNANSNDTSSKSKSRIKNDVTFFINETEYQLTWWNQNGKYQPNAFAFINMTEYNRKREEYDSDQQSEEKKEDGPSNTKKKNKNPPNPIELCYMRFKCVPEQQKLAWEWYDSFSFVPCEHYIIHI